jgi:molybdopterin-containing oxidoreductase family membrane subunit
MTGLEGRVLGALGVTGRIFQVLMVVLVLLVVAMAFSLYYHQDDGSAPEGTSETGYWGVHNTTFVFFVGLSLAGVLTVGLGRLLGGGATAPVSRIAGVTAVAAAITALLSVILGIGDLGTFVDTILYGHVTNPVVFAGLVVAVYLVVASGLVYFPMVPDLERAALKVDGNRWLYRILSFGYTGTKAQEEDLRKLTKRVALLSVIAVLAVHTVLAWGMDRVGDQPPWNEAIAGPYFITEAFLAGYSLMLVIALLVNRVLGLGPALSDRVIRPMAIILLVALVLHLVTWIAWTLGQDEPGSVWTGDFGVITLAVLVAGFIAPVALLGLQRRWSLDGLLVASTLVATTMWVKQNVLLVPGLTAHSTAGDVGIYSLTVPEAGLVLGSFGMFLLITAILLKLVPPVSLWDADEAGIVLQEAEVAGE